MADSSPKGFFTDTTICIGCKACEVACKQWNQLPEDGYNFSGNSYDNTMHLSGDTWRHVSFVERPAPEFSWLMMSDVCKHCQRAGCLEACPTGSIIRTEFDSVFVQPDICNGCGYCVSACPFGVINRVESDGRAWKCTLCYDRLKEGMEPACAKACPTDSIQFGDVADMRARAERRVSELHSKGVNEAYIYGTDQPGTEGLNAIFLLMDKPEVYNLPTDPVVPTKYAAAAWKSAGLASLGILLAAAVAAFFGSERR